MEKWENYTEEELKEKLQPTCERLIEAYNQTKKAVMPIVEAIIEATSKALGAMEPFMEDVKEVAQIYIDTARLLNAAEFKSNNWRKMHGLPLYRYKQLERVIEWN